MRQWENIGERIKGRKNEDSKGNASLSTLSSIRKRADRSEKTRKIKQLGTVRTAVGRF